MGSTLLYPLCTPLCTLQESCLFAEAIGDLWPKARFEKDTVFFRFLKCISQILKMYFYKKKVVWLQLGNL